MRGSVPSCGWLLLLLLLCSCNTYGGRTVEVSIRFEPSGGNQVKAQAGVEAWLLDLRAWRALDCQNEISKIQDLVRDGDHERAATESKGLASRLGRRAIRTLRGDSKEKLRCTTLYIVTRYGGQLTWTSFDASTQRDVQVALPIVKS